jgi:hypothetical protein
MSDVVSKLRPTVAFIGDSGTGGKPGSVPAPAALDAANQKFLRADGTWAATPSSATWPQAAIRYYAVDYDGGSDANLGFSDVSMAAAGAVALKTLEQLGEIFPRIGNNNVAVVAIKARAGGAAYRNKADTDDDSTFFLQGVYGYKHVLVRGTGDVATAGATAFANDTADRIACGSQIVLGTSATGYEPTGVPTSSVFTCQITGGGAPGLAAEPALIGKRIRFDSATTTVALQNATAMIHQNTADTITVATNLPAVPALTDVFYIEEPGLAVNQVLVETSNPSEIADGASFAQRGVFVVGFRTTAPAGKSINCAGSTARVSLAFVEGNTTSFSDIRIGDAFTAAITNTYVSGDFTTVTVGVGARTPGGITCSGIRSLTIQTVAMTAARFQLIDVITGSVGSGSYSALGALIQGCGTFVTPTSALPGFQVGNGGSATIRPFRCVGAFTAIINITRSNCSVRGCDLTGAGASPLIWLRGLGQNVNVNNCTGSAGNTGSGLSLSDARACNVTMGNLGSNTFTGAANRDIEGSGGSFWTHADLSLSDIADSHANRISGASVATTSLEILFTNDGTLDIPQYSVVRATGNSLVRAALADSAANASGVVAVIQSRLMNTAATTVGSGITAGAGWIQFDGAPAAGDVAYLSHLNAGQARNTSPPVAGTNQKLRLGIVLRVSGTVGLVLWHPESVPVTSDGGP